MSVHTHLYRRLAELSAAEVPCALVTIVKATGSVPNELGAKMLVGADGALLAGTIGGGRIEHQAMGAAADAIGLGKSRSFESKLTPAEAGGIGMNCGGSVEVFIDVLLAAPRLLLCGAGHISLALARMTRGLGFDVTVVDHRAEWANAQNYPDVRVVVADPAEHIRDHGLNDRTFVVVATPAGDLGVVTAAAATEARYIGVVASKRKGINLLRELHQETPELYDALLPRYRAPVGLALGGRAPEAVALSVLAEVQAERHGTSPDAMSLSPERLHDLILRKGVRVIGGS